MRWGSSWIMSGSTFGRRWKASRKPWASKCPKTIPRGGREPPKDQNKPLYEALERASKFYEHALRQHAERHKVVNYLKGRGLTGEIARDFRIGFAPAGWDNLIQANGSDDTAQELLETLRDAGDQ